MHPPPPVVALEAENDMIELEDNERVTVKDEEEEVCTNVEEPLKERVCIFKSTILCDSSAFRTVLRTFCNLGNLLPLAFFWISIMDASFGCTRRLWTLLLL